MTDISVPRKGFYHYPDSTVVNRNLPKNKIYEQVKADAKLKETFVTQIEQIIWAHKLSAQTLNIDASEVVPEVQIFHIALKGEELCQDALQAVDKAIPLPIIFEVKTASNKLKVMACFKSVGVNGGITLSEYYQSDVLLNGDGNEARADMPLSLNTKALYEQLLASLLPYGLRENESFSELIKRIDLMKNFEKKQQQINKKLSNEKQFKKKVAINAELKEIKKKLKQLQS